MAILTDASDVLTDTGGDILIDQWEETHVAARGFIPIIALFAGWLPVLAAPAGFRPIIAVFDPFAPVAVRAEAFAPLAAHAEVEETP
jgi:hypothetical protein